MRQRRGLILLVAAVLLAGRTSAQAIEVELRGAIMHPGRHGFAADARLSAAALAAEPRPDAYLIGAAWLRVNQRPAQRRLQAGILFDLDAVHRQALADGDDDLAALTVALARWLRALPVTGRAIALLDPRKVEITAEENRPLADGDVLDYPRRPGTVRIVGAVLRPCAVPHVALRDAADYLHDCPRATTADPDWLYVIEPDGRVFKQGVALWNRSAPLALAPGARLYVPLGHAAARIAPELNRELADFIATQPLSAEGE
jgi:hypothetical protein